jgi:predicted nucleic acid-binding protein
VHLLSLAGKILIPPLVVTEFEANAQGWSPPQWVQIIALENSGRRKAERWIRTQQIHAGEAEAIGLALQEHADWLLTDDASARQFAESLGLEVHGSIAILLWSIATGIGSPNHPYGFLIEYCRRHTKPSILCLNKDSYQAPSRISGYSQNNKILDAKLS